MKKIILSLALVMNVQAYEEIYFQRLESLCRDIYNDLDVSNTNQAVAAHMHAENYLLKQFLLLQHTLEAFINNKEEVRIYLWQDLAYLREIIELLEKKYSEGLYTQEQHTPKILAIFAHGKDQLEQLLANNYEVTLY